MDKIFFTDWQSIIRILIISFVAYPALIIILRISGKRTLSKMNAFDLIITISLGSTLASVILTKDIPLSEGILTFIILVGFQYIITHLTLRNKKVNRLVKSSPVLMVYKGELLERNRRKERIHTDEIWAILREKGFSALDQIDAIILETDGSLSVIKEVQSRESEAIKELFE